MSDKMRKKILAPGIAPVVGRWAEQPRADLLKELQEEMEKVADVDIRRPVSPQEWADALNDVNIVAGGVRVDESFLKRADELEMIQTFGIGYDSIDIPVCTEKGVLVCNVAEIYSEPVAQHTWALILDLSKNVSKADKSMRDGTWESRNWMGFQLWGKTLGIIGLGANGGRIAMKGRMAFGMRVLAYDPYVLPAGAQRWGAELVSLEKVLKESDVVVLAVLLNAETRHMIGEKQLSLMKKSAILVNTCRGAVLDEQALIKCLQNGGIRGAGLDVFEQEPLSPNSPLLMLENVVLTPHIASSTHEAVEGTYRGAVANIIAYLNGRRPNWIINPDAYKARRS